MYVNPTQHNHRMNMRRFSIPHAQSPLIRANLFCCCCWWCTPAINFSAASSPLCIPTPIHFIRSWPGQLCRYPCLPSLSRVVRRRSDSGEDGRDKINACRVGVVACIFQEDEQSELWWWCEDNENQHIIGFLRLQMEKQLNYHLSRTNNSQCH